MPIFSGDALGIGVGMDGKDFGMSLRTRRVWVNVQLAETAPERLVAFHVKRLIAKEQDLMLRQRLVQLFGLAVTERFGERQAVDLGANARRDRRDVDGFVAHGATFQSANIDHISGNRVMAYAAENPSYLNGCQGCLYRKLDSAIMVMKSAEDGRRYDAASVVDGAMDRSVLVEGSMSHQLVIIGGILRQNTAYVPFA